MGGHSNYANANEISIERDADTGAKSTSPWVKKLSDKPLTEGQECLLAYGPNFAVIPRCQPSGEYIVVIEHACWKLNQGEAEELRVEVKNILKKTQMPKSNITKEEFQAIKELKKRMTTEWSWLQIRGGHGGVKQRRLHKEGRRSIEPTNIKEDSRRSYIQTEDQIYKPA